MWSMLGLGFGGGVVGVGGFALLSVLSRFWRCLGGGVDVLAVLVVGGGVVLAVLVYSCALYCCCCCCRRTGIVLARNFCVVYGNEVMSAQSLDFYPVSTRSRNGAPSLKGRVINGQI